MGVKHTLPGLKVPVVDFWSFMVYDVHTLSILETDQKYGEINSKLEGINLDENRSVQIFFHPVALQGQKTDWVQIVPNNGFHCILRLY